MSEAILKMVKKTLVDPLKRRIMNMVCRGVVEFINNTGGLQLVSGTLMADEVVNDAEHLGEYGFASVAPAGSEMVTLFWGGNRDHPIVLSINDAASRKKDLTEGDSALYTQLGSYIHLKQIGQEIEIFIPPGLGKIRLNADVIELCAREKIKWDVLGRGYDYLPLLTNSFELPFVVGAVNDAAPPEHP